MCLVSQRNVYFRSRYKTLTLSYHNPCTKGLCSSDSFFPGGSFQCFRICSYLLFKKTQELGTEYVTNTNYTPFSVAALRLLDPSHAPVTCTLAQSIRYHLPLWLPLPLALYRSQLPNISSLRQIFLRVLFI